MIKPDTVEDFFRPRDEGVADQMQIQISQPVEEEVGRHDTVYLSFEAHPVAAVNESKSSKGEAGPILGEGIDAGSPSEDKPVEEAAAPTTEEP